MPETWPLVQTLVLDCQSYRERFIERTIGHPPHTLLEHLAERIGEVQLGARPPFRTRLLGPDGVVHFPRVSEPYVARLLNRAQEIQWLPDMDIDVDSEILTPMKTWRFTVPPSGQWRYEWHDKLVLTDGYYPGERLTTNKFRKDVERAERIIRAIVEPGLLRRIGLPPIVVFPDESPRVGGNGVAQYVSATGRIHIVHSQVTAVRLLHEFGHHVEERGPVEVWCAALSFLQHRARAGTKRGEEVVLVRSRTNGVGYPHDPLLKPLPEQDYGYTYYPDGGTELIALGLEHLFQQFLRDDDSDTPGREIRWGSESGGYSPYLLWLVLQAVRPDDFYRTYWRTVLEPPMLFKLKPPKGDKG